MDSDDTIHDRRSNVALDWMWGDSERRRRRLRARELSVLGTGPEGADVQVRRVGYLEAFFLRLANFLVAAIALLILSPLMLLVSILIRIDSPGPVLYRQLRVGLDRRSLRDLEDGSGRRASDLGGRPFMIYKFRTMHTKAELETGPVWATRDDDRTTRVGRWLRRARIDEIPQFWNVLLGEMSVVGPRPERPAFVRHLQREISEYRLRNRVPPGITGWAQVNQGYDQDLEDVRSKVGYDLEYLERRSLWFDLWIMLKTLPVMFERD